MLVWYLIHEYDLTITRPDKGYLNSQHYFLLFITCIGLFTNSLHSHVQSTALERHKEFLIRLR